MRFLGNEAEGRHVMPLSIIYDNPREASDMLMILYKDIDTGEKFVKNIENPEIDIYIVKEQYRNQSPAENPLNMDGSYRPDFYMKDQCDVVRVKYRKRKYAAAKILGISPEDVDASPYVGGTDMDIRHWYFVEFLHEYSNDLPKPISVGYYDIEADTRGYGTNEFGDNYGKFPITAITYISDVRNQVYVFVLNCPEFGRMDEIINNTEGLRREMHEEFDEKFGTMEYNIVIFDKEIEMINAFWALVKAVEDDFTLAWNAPFDIGNLTYRPAELGYDPVSIIHDPRFARKVVIFNEDRATFVAHKKRHKITYTLPTILDDHMRIYSGVRSARGKLPSTALDKVAKREKIGGKKTYEGDINQFMLTNFWDYIIYNVNDVHLMRAINNKVNDTGDIYSRMLNSGVSNDEVFVSTTIWAQYIKNDLESKRGRFLANNKNKFLAKTQEIIEYGFDSDAVDEDDGDDEDESDECLQEVLGAIADQQNLIDEKTGKKKKFAGAIVLDTRRTRYTGTKINGMECNFVHRHAIDQDITSEYPTAITISNQSNDTFVGKIYVDDADEIKLPFYEQYSFLDNKDASEYKCNKAALMLETAIQGDYMMVGEIALGLPKLADLEKMVINMAGDKLTKGDK